MSASEPPSLTESTGLHPLLVRGHLGWLPAMAGGARLYAWSRIIELGGAVGGVLMAVRVGSGAGAPVPPAGVAYAALGLVGAVLAFIGAVRVLGFPGSAPRPGPRWPFGPAMLVLALNVLLRLLFVVGAAVPVGTEYAAALLVAARVVAGGQLFVDLALLMTLTHAAGALKADRLLSTLTRLFIVVMSARVLQQLASHAWLVARLRESGAAGGVIRSAGMLLGVAVAAVTVWQIVVLFRTHRVFWRATVEGRAAEQEFTGRGSPG